MNANPKFLNTTAHVDAGAVKPLPNSRKVYIPGSSADIQVPTLSGERVTLRVKPGTQSGTRHRVKGRGIETAKHHGDLIVTVDVVVPTDLNDEQRAAVEALAAATTETPRNHLFTGERS